MTSRERRGPAVPRVACVAVAVFTAVWLSAPASEASAASSVEFTTVTFLQSGAPATWFLRGLIHLERRAALGAAAVTLTLDPGVLLDLSGLGSTRWSWGLTEAYLRHRRGPYELRAGVERLPLESARLMIPFSVEPVDALGTRLGRAGLRVIWAPDAATRVRAALLEHSGALLPALSLRRQFPSWELEGHALMLPAGRAAVGVGGSGLLGGLVAYGEAWTLTAPPEGRYAVGLSGSIRNGLWTLEGGNAAAAVLGGVVLDAEVRRQAAGQIVYRLSEELAITATARVFLDGGPDRGQAMVQFSRLNGNTEYALGVIALMGAGPPRGIVTVGVSFSF